MLRLSRVVTLLGGLAMLCLLVAAPAQATHPRPKGTGVYKTALVPAYAECAAPNRTHGPPLAFPSCNPPAQTSAEATVGTPDANGSPVSFNSYILFTPCVGVPGPPEDSDLRLDIPLNDVRCTSASCGNANASGPADYSGQVRVAFTMRLTDHFNAASPGGGIEPATVQDTSIEASFTCAQTASTSTGSTCSMRTSFNAFIPGSVKDTKRALMEVDDLRVYDGGADGVGSTAADNTVFLRPGVFIP
jgi:hypothetical protein